MNKLLDTAILTRLSYFHLPAMVELLRHFGSATAIVEQAKDLPDMFPGMPRRLKEALGDIDTIRPRAEEELAFCEEHGISMLCLGDDDYPQRLKDCVDAPLMLFYKGTADLNSKHIINIVGTRHATPYGRDIIHNLVGDLSQLCPDVVVVSGLAYGIDICAHRECLQHGLDTVGVLAHGLDDLYPPAHRDTAHEMLSHGGLLTEFMTHTRADKMNFVRRNRITAGLCDATILVESAKKGGGLITCRISSEYGRDTFTFPGPVGAPYSEGCNNLIRNHGAQLITSAHDLLESLGWEHAAEEQQRRRQGVQRQIFPTLTDDEQKIADLLRKTNDLQLNIISARTGLAIPQATSSLFSMEMKGVVRPLVGGTYHLFL